MNRELTYKQYFALILISLTVINFVIIPLVTINIFLIIFGILLSYVYCCLYIYLKGRFCSNNKFIKYIISAKSIITASLVLSLYVKTINNVFTEDINKYLIMTFTFIACAYCGCKGEAVFRVSRMLYNFVLIPILSVILFSFKDIKLYNIIECFYDFNIGDILIISIVSMFFEIPVLLSQYCKFNLTVSRYSYPALISYIIIILSDICITGRFGKSALNYKYPSLELMYSSDMYFIQRQEGIFIPMLILGLIIIISLYIMLSLKMEYKKTTLIIIYLLTIILLSHTNLYIPINTVLGIVLMIFLFISKGDKNEV